MFLLDFLQDFCNFMQLAYKVHTYIHPFENVFVTLENQTQGPHHGTEFIFSIHALEWSISFDFPIIARYILHDKDVNVTILQVAEGHTKWLDRITSQKRCQSGMEGFSSAQEGSLSLGEGSRKSSGADLVKRPPRKELGRVRFKDPLTGLEKVGAVEASGEIRDLLNSSLYENPVDWLLDAPLREPDPTPAEVEEGVRRLSEDDNAQVDFEMDLSETRQRRRSKSVQSPTSTGEANSILQSVDEMTPFAEDEAVKDCLEGESRLELWKKVCFATVANPALAFADAIVRSCNLSLLEANNGDFWDAATARAGSRLLAAMKLALAQTGEESFQAADVVVTPAFELPLKFIVHICSPSERLSTEKLEQYYSKVLQRFKDESFESVILTPIGDQSFGEDFMQESMLALVRSLLKTLDGENPIVHNAALQKLAILSTDASETEFLKKAFLETDPSS